MNEAIPRPMEGWYLRDALKKLAEICVVADCLRYDLEPLSDEDLEIGAEPLEYEQIAETLHKIAQLATDFALKELKVTSEEWYAANDAIQ